MIPAEGAPMTDPRQAREKLGLDAAQFNELRAFLDGRTFGLKVVCDHTHARTEEWAGRMGVDMEALVETLKTLGGDCDCKIVANVTPDKLGW